jgi:hypothetical protein
MGGAVGSMLWANGTTTRPNVSSGFGRRPVTIAGASSFHRGCDFTGYATVRAVAAGKVVHVGWMAGWPTGGYMVWIQHDGFLSRSLHLVNGSARVHVGQWIDAGDALATMGATGINGGVHHHLEIVVNGVQVDPVPFITARLTARTSAAAFVAAVAPLEEDDMLLLNLKTKTGDHKVALGQGSFRHFIPGDPYDQVMRLSRIQDDWQDVQEHELPALLRTWGCDLDCYEIRNGQLLVKDPIAGITATGRVWTAANEIRAQNERILAKLG